MRTKILIAEADFDPGAELEALNLPGAGGIASFTGTVRNDTGNLAALHLEHYPGMTERALDNIITQAASRWPLLGCTIIHRVGRLTPGQRIVFTAAASAHRQAALAATGFLIDWLKTGAPFWKREEFKDGASQWVEARESDEEETAKWK
jgi:molybdopterin synthase catalytic subunit